MSAYHLNDIPKGVLGEFSKIEEEFLELKDAHTQNSPLLQLCELADLLGAIEAYSLKYNMTLNDLLLMTRATERAFKNGDRK